MCVCISMCVCVGVCEHVEVCVCRRDAHRRLLLLMLSARVSKN